MASSYSSSSSSSKSKPQWRYDVFINFRGKDTRKNFVSHLYSALANAGVNAFLDDEKLSKGEELSSELFHAIEGSQISIVVLSQNYIHSTWCLDELVKIMECHALRGQVVMPVFYDIAPSLLRDAQYISFEVIFEKDSDVHRMKLWKNALTQAADLAGSCWRSYRKFSGIAGCYGWLFKA
ncbi:TMV resistance protein N, partial [Mucuna pruriens]